MSADGIGDDGRDALRAGELIVAPGPFDAGLCFIGRIETPFLTRDDCPRQGSHDGPECRIVVDPRYEAALAGLQEFAHIEVLYWLHRARRDLVVQSPKANGETRGTFALRSPLRPNPIGTSLVRLVGIEGCVVTVRGLDCLDGTPLLDLKPDRCAYSPLVLPKGLASRP